MYPEHSEIKDALLRHIYNHGGPKYVVRAKEAYEPLADMFKLSHTERTQPRQTRPSSPRWHNLVQTARRSLVEEGMLRSLEESGHGNWQLSAAAVNRLNRKR